MLVVELVEEDVELRESKLLHRNQHSKTKLYVVLVEVVDDVELNQYFNCKIYGMLNRSNIYLVAVVVVVELEFRYSIIKYKKQK